MISTACILRLAASIAGATEFSLGIYNATTPEDYPLIAAAGFTLVDVRVSDPARQMALAAAARTAGMRVMANPRPYLNTPREKIDVDIDAWHLFDEPEVNRDSTSSIAGLYSRVRDWDSQTPGVIVVGDGASASLYSKWADVVALDWYPIPHLKLQTLSTEMAKAISGSAGKPVWAIIQAMDWRDYPQRNPRLPRVGRFPEEWEIRSMSYLALAEGARSLLYYTYTSPKGTTLISTPERWERLARVTSEIRRYKCFFDAGPGTLLSKAPVLRRRWTLGRRKLTVSVNTSNPAQVTVIESP